MKTLRKERSFLMSGNKFEWKDLDSQKCGTYGQIHGRWEQGGDEHLCETGSSGNLGLLVVIQESWC